MKPSAVYIGWQRDIDGAHFPLFNIEGDHPLMHSTVDANTLFREQIPIPPVPPCPFEEKIPAIYLGG